jgi:catechol 2,3-dioxygenase-like lactoylglutathione lyase family enzyme
MIAIERLDHLVLTVADIDRTCAFYEGVLGFTVVTFGNGRRALQFGQQKVNLHQQGHEFEPKAARPTPGSADLCLITAMPIAEVQQALLAAGQVIEEGPVARTGALGPITSLYIRDPDQNLIEIATYGP